MHGGAPGSGAPRGNQNALKHGRYTKAGIEERRQTPGVNTAVAKAAARYRVIHPEQIFKQLRIDTGCMYIRKRRVAKLKAGPRLV
jgi:uncharacterized protein YjcR